MAHAEELIARIMADERFRASAHFSDAVYRDEPILVTGRQMSSYLPDRYREMRAISRWETGSAHSGGRWLSEAELFYKQAVFMADFEDSCPYRGTFKSHFPTYNAMSDRQLRGYFTWRAAVRAGDVQETSTAFAFVYMYELIIGAGVADAQEGFERLRDFWQSYRAFEPAIDRCAQVWLQDYVVYHGLDPQLLNDSETLEFDRSLMALRLATERAVAVDAANADAQGGKRKRGASPAGALLPVDAALEDELFTAIDALSTHRLSTSRLYHDHRDDLRHVACAVFVRMEAYYRAHRASGMLESLFGEEATMPYTMFASAMFFEPEPHADGTFELNPIHRYRCRNGLWERTCVHGARTRSAQLGSMMHAVDRLLRAALAFEHPLQEEKRTPKYLTKIIETEIAAWLAWKRAHAPRVIDIDLSALSGIRAAAATTREALLVDEEREEAPEVQEPALPAEVAAGPGADTAFPAFPGPSAADRTDSAGAASADAAVPAPMPEPDPGPAMHRDIEPARAGAPDTAGPDPAPTTGAAGVHAMGPLDENQAAFLRALLAQDTAGQEAALARAGTTQDMLVDAINDALFDLLGDVAIEFTETGPEPIEDYLSDLREVVDHA